MSDAEKIRKRLAIERRKWESTCSRRKWEYLARVMEAERAPPMTPAPPPDPRDALGSYIVYERHYVMRRDHRFAIVRPLNRSPAKNGEDKVRCEVLWPERKRDDRVKHIESCELFPLDPAELGRQWQALTQFCRDYVKEMEDD